MKIKSYIFNGVKSPLIIGYLPQYTKLFSCLADFRARWSILWRQTNILT